MEEIGREIASASAFPGDRAEFCGVGSGVDCIKTISGQTENGAKSDSSDDDSVELPKEGKKVKKIGDKDVDPDDSISSAKKNGQEVEFPLSAIEKIIKARYSGKDLNKQFRVMLKDMTTAFITRATELANANLETSKKRVLTNADFAHALEAMRLGQHAPEASEVHRPAKQSTTAAFKKQMSDPEVYARLLAEQAAYINQFRALEQQAHEGVCLAEVESAVTAIDGATPQAAARTGEINNIPTTTSDQPAQLESLANPSESGPKSDENDEDSIDFDCDDDSEAAAKVSKVIP